MAHHVEPMDIDSDFDNKENSLHHNNVLPFTEKGYEELDVSELNMKLRYSVTPASSPMSKSYTANCPDIRTLESGDDSLNVTVNENINLTRSLNSTINRNDNVIKSLKSLPLQTISSEQFTDSNRNASVLRPIDSTVTEDNGNITVTVSGPSDIDENLSLPSSSSSALHTPEATTPTKDIPHKDGGSPIMRGLKSVLSMFRSSQSPIPPGDNENPLKPDILSPAEGEVSTTENKAQAVLASTPISAHRKKEMSPTKRSSPQKDNSIVFSDDLEKELQWKDETTIIFSQERIPIHKLMLQQPQDCKIFNPELPSQDTQDLNSTVEYMDISYNDSIRDKTITETEKKDISIAESDSEFVDCETTFTENDSQVIEDMDKTPIVDQTQDLDLTKDIEVTNESGSRLKQIILDTTQDILDATLSVRPEDLLPEAAVQTKEVTALVLDKTDTLEVSKVTDDVSETSQVNQRIFNQTVDVISSLEAKTENDITTEIANTTTNQVFDQTFVPTAVNDDYPKEILDVTNTISAIQPSDTNMDSQNEFLDISKPAANILEVTQTLNNQTIENLQVSDNINLSETVTIDNTTFVAQVTPVEDNVNGNAVESPLDIQAQEPINTAINVDIPISPSLIPTATNQTINEPVAELIPVPEYDTVKEASMTELPVDIPLPDEDDLDKEINFPDSISDITTPPISLPLDLVDDIKPPEVIEIPQTRPTYESNQQLNEFSNNNYENILPEVCAPMFDNVDNINNSESIQDVEVKNKSEIDTPEILKSGNDDPLPQVVTTSNEIVIQPNTELNTFNETNLAMNVIENTNIIDTEKNIENNVVENNDVIPMDVNESISEFNPLPDIVNETITMSNIDSEITATKPSSAVPEFLVLEQLATKPENIILTTTDSTCPDVTPETTIEMQQEVPFITKSESIKRVPPGVDAIASDDLSSDLATICSLEEPITKTKTVADFIQSSGNVTIPTDNALLLDENVSLQEEVKEHIDENNKSKADEEIVLSENNSPFVSVIAENINEIKLENDPETVNIEDNLAEKPSEIAPSSSPPIRSKGYSFNFDDLDFNPFSTKTAIRMSPPLDSPQKVDAEPTAQVKAVERPVLRKDANRRKSQPERKKPVAPKRKLNSTFDSSSTNKPVKKFDTAPTGDIQLDSPPTVALNPNNVTIEEKHTSENVNAIQEKVDISKEMIKSEQEDVLEKSIEQSVETPTTINESNLHEIRTTSSSEQSTYFSAGTSLSESSIPSKNVFNLPEIDDINFNPFASKSKMRQSPPPSLDDDNPFATKSKIASSPDTSMIRPQLEELNTASLQDKIETEPMERDSVGDISNVTASSKATVKDTNTEDEDTVEGPFLDVDDLNPDDKMSDFDGENIDMMQFTDLPQPVNDEHPDNGDSGEMFIDAEAFEFLLNQNKTNTIVDSGKESLFLKFDPLFAKRMSAITTEGVLASLAKLQKKQSTPTKAAPTSPKNMPSPIAGPSNLNITQDLDMNISEEYNDDLNITVSKPMMVVPPAVNPVTPRNKSLTPNRSNRRSITFTSPAMAVIDRLLSLSGNNSLIHDATVTHASREQNEADTALSQLRELLAEKEISVYSLKSESNELRDRLNTLEGNVKALENESQDRLKKINQLNDTLAEKTKINRSMAAVVEEYERTIASLIAEIAQDKKRHAEERMQLINERDEQTAHLASMEVSFSDLHSKYEKSKQIILHCKANEDEYKKSIKEFEENLTKMQNNYELLKQHATSKLNHANQELEKMNRSHEAEVLKLSAMIKRKDLHITSLEESLVQKTKANEELTAICDELINKVG